MTELIPAIDIIGGECVRLTRGDYSRKSVYGSSPVDMAKAFADAGATTLHLVDLDGAKASCPANLDILGQIVASTPLKVEWGGGIKSEENARRVLEAGADRVVCGSIAATRPDEMSRWLRLFGGERIVLGADVRRGKVATHGWERDSEFSALDLIGRFVADGLSQAVCTEISRDGTLSGPDWDFYDSLQRAFGERVLITVSGGVASMADIREAARRGLPRIIVGKAYYEGHITLEDMRLWWQNA